MMLGCVGKNINNIFKEIVSHKSIMQDLKQAIVLYASIFKNIIENPLCDCGEIEDPFHFFFF